MVQACRRRKPEVKRLKCVETSTLYFRRPLQKSGPTHGPLRSIAGICNKFTSRFQIHDRRICLRSASGPPMPPFGPPGPPISPPGPPFMPPGPPNGPPVPPIGPPGPPMGPPELPFGPPESSGSSGVLRSPPETSGDSFGSARHQSLLGGLQIACTMGILKQYHIQIDRTMVFLESRF